jgi:predicted ATPase/class 3 adenylate cyclase/DNA-binding CsgD family transcriptional regulator/tetratricopeptide (TPR) repeat protein
VTFLFTDIEGSTALWESVPDAMRAAQERHDAILRSTIDKYAGHVFSSAGDGLGAAFARVGDAVGAAVEAQRALACEPWPTAAPLRVRMGVHTGEATERDGDYFGPAVNRCARLMAVAHGGQLVCSGVTADLVADRLGPGIGLRDLGQHRLKDLGRPERVFQVTGPGLEETFDLLRSLDGPARRHNLPLQTTSFVGRTAEMAELASLVAGGRQLVTVVGPGGIGKTRLGLQVTAEAVDVIGEGVWLVELASVADPELVARTVAAVLRVREEPGRPLLDTLVDAVGDRCMLVMLDNAEHVLDATAKLVDALLRCCPQLRLLVTSREPLGLGGEHVFRVPSLSVPTGEAATPQQLAAFEAVQLFTERASLQRPGFVLDEANAAAVSAVCARLDGIPLALELAAARLGSLSVSEINARLDQRLRLLIGGSRTDLPRHQTLRAMIDWSYNLLNLDERLVFDRLSVFAGGWTLEAAEAVATGGEIEDWQVLDRLAALVAKSLVQADDVDGFTRYRLLETVRQYGTERLTSRAVPEQDRVRRAHRDHFLALVETADAHLNGSGQVGWLDRLEVDFDNIRAALAFSVEDPDSPEPGLRLAAGLRWFCDMRGHAGEILNVLDALLARPDTQPPSLTRARVLNAISWLIDRFGDGAAVPGRVRSMAEEALSIARAAAEETVAAGALAQLSWSDFAEGDLPGAMAQIDEAISLARKTGDPRLGGYLNERAVFKAEGGDWDGALADYEEALALLRVQGDKYRLAITLANMGVVELSVGEVQGARAHIEEARSVADHLGVPTIFTTLWANLGMVALLEADARGARRHFLDSLTAARRTGANWSVPDALLGLALTASAEGDTTLAATLHGVADEALGPAGQETFHSLEARLRERDHNYLRGELGDGPFAVAYGQGHRLSQVEAIALATASVAEGEAPTVPGNPPAGILPAGGHEPPTDERAVLSEREQEVLALLAGGATDAQIADTLFLSVNTVRSHLDRIRDKTGARRRTELARYATQAGIESIVPPP